MRRITVLSALLALLLAAAAAAAQSGYPDHRELEVNDFAGILSAQETERLRGLLRDLRQRTGIEATVVTIESIGDYGTGDRSIESFATGLFNAWGVGDAERDDGVMVLVAVGDRKVRIEVGSGYGSSEDRAMKAVIDSAMLPHFRNGDYGRGIVQGTETVVAHFGRTPAAPGASVPTEAPSATPGTSDPGPQQRGGFLGWLLGLLAAGLGGGGFWLARRPPRCGRCGNPMAAMDEQLDEAERETRDRILHSRTRRSELALALLQREMRLKALQEKAIHLAIDTQDSTLALRHGSATLRQIPLHIGGDSVITAPDGRTWRFVRALGERHLQEKERNPTVTIPEWVYIGRGEPVPSEAQRRMEGGGGSYVLQLDDGTEIYSRPEEGPFASGVKPGSFMAEEEELATITLKVSGPITPTDTA